MGKAVSTELFLAGLEASEEATEDSSMESEAIVPGAGAKDAGIPVGGCCFFLMASL